MRGLISVLLLSLSSSVLLAQPRYFDWKEVAPGVYAAIGKPGVLSNAAVILTEEGVVVVDAHLRPSWAQDLLAHIRRITDRPVRFVINTHWHNDHTQGNRAYQAAFPRGTVFIAHHRTREDLLSKGIPNLEQTRRMLPERITRLRQQLAEGKGRMEALWMRPRVEPWKLSLPTAKPICASWNSWRSHFRT